MADRLWTGKSPGIIYLVQRSDGLCKIGHTSNLKQRFRLMRYENRGYELSLVHSLVVTHRISIEAFWHKLFGSKRIRREWFRLSDSDVLLFRSCTEETIGDILAAISNLCGRTL